MELQNVITETSMIYHYRVTIIVHLMHLGKWYSAPAIKYWTTKGETWGESCVILDKV